VWVYDSKRATALKQATDEVKQTQGDTERAQTAASGKLKEVKSDVTQTKEQINAVSIQYISLKKKSFCKCIDSF